jgi:xanthine/CO dehydrogenase XdhC/CoxF family maturation factor
MKELYEIIKAYDTATKVGKASVLATVVHLEGSSYRRPGARMLVLEDGMMIGAISGGCLEGDALKKALLTFTEKKSRLVTYDTSDEEDVNVGIQLGCEGVIQVLFEFIDSANVFNPIELLRKVTANRQQAVVVTLFDLTDKKNNQIGTCLVKEQNGTITDVMQQSALKELIKHDVNEAMLNGQSAVINYASAGIICNAFVECIFPPISLVVVGAGNDAISIMQIATVLGWEVKVVDGRQTHAKAERFINACQVLVSKPELVLQQISIDNRTCFVLMTHNYQYDLQMLKALLATQVHYIGVLGPKKKLLKMLDALKQEGVILTEAMLARIYGPTGLDIGAETPEEIAVSIIAEIQAAFTGKEGTMLKWKQDLIHSK